MGDWTQSVSVENRKKKKVGLGENNVKSKVIYALFMLIPTLQFVLFYIIVNINSFSLAFKYFPTGVSTKYEWAWNNFGRWFEATAWEELSAAISVSVKSYFIVLVINIPLGLFFSYYMFKKFLGAGMFRVLLFMPSILSASVLAVIYQNFTDMALGGANGILSKWSTETIFLWDTGEKKYFMMVFFSLFFGFGTNVLMYTNKMNGIDPEMIESAQLDGASGFTEFWYIVLPQTFSIVQVFLVTGFSAIFTNQYNSMMFFGYEPGPEVQTVGYLLWRGVQKAGNDVTKMGAFAALGLMITAVIVPLTFLLRGLLNKYGWKED